jgi:putative ABC transport system permease protein
VKFLPLLLANLGRKRLRTLLTIGSFAVAIFLFGLLATIRAAFSQGIDAAGADRLMVINRASIIQPLPLAYADRLARVPGVTAVSYASWFGGVYQDERNFFPQFAVHAETWRQLYPEFVIPEDQWQAFLADRAGCVVGRATAERFNWVVGQRIPIKGAIFPGEWQFNLRGIYTGKRPTDDLTQFWFRADYLQEAGPEYIKGYIGWYVVRIGTPDQAAAVTQAIDARFANSAFETRAQSEKALAAGFVKQMGNIELLMLSIGGVVFFTLLLVTGNTMAGAVRERTGELAVLKALGYSDGFVVALVLIESCLIALAGGLLGLAGAKLLTLGGDPTGGLLAVFYLPTGAVLVGLALALAVGVAAALQPAASARRLQVVEALRRL